MEPYQKISQLYKDLSHAQTDYHRRLAEINRLSPMEALAQEKDVAREEARQAWEALDQRLRQELRTAQADQARAQSDRVVGLMKEKRKSGFYDL
jgi:primosomal protein N''